VEADPLSSRPFEQMKGLGRGKAALAASHQSSTICSEMPAAKADHAMISRSQTS
jgi:hypothetical protein